MADLLTRRRRVGRRAINAPTLSNASPSSPVNWVSPSSALMADRGRVDLIGCRRAVPAASLPVNFLFWRTFCSGAALVPGAHCSHRRTISWQLSVMRTPVALPPVLKRMEQRMPEHRRFTQTISREGSLPEEAKRLRKQAQGTLPGIERERLVRRAHQLETASRMNDWLTSCGRRAPKQGQ
jgi:hypothetical protein